MPWQHQIVVRQLKVSYLFQLTEGKKIMRRHLCLLTSYYISLNTNKLSFLLQNGLSFMSESWLCVHLKFSYLIISVVSFRASPRRSCGGAEWDSITVLPLIVFLRWKHIHTYHAAFIYLSMLMTMWLILTIILLQWLSLIKVHLLWLFHFGREHQIQAVFLHHLWLLSFNFHFLIWINSARTWWAENMYVWLRLEKGEKWEGKSKSGIRIADVK